MELRFLTFCLLLVGASMSFATAGQINGSKNGIGPLLKSGDRMVFLGDSITEQRIYTRYVMNYFTLHYPDAKIWYRNAGWGGDTAPGGLSRLKRDVLSLKPTVVSICFGMNDGRYKAYDQEDFDTYINGMKGLISELKESGVKVVLLTPGCVDPDRNPELKGYNDTLGDFAKGIIQLAQDEKLPVFNTRTAMLGVQNKAKKDNSEFTMIPDGVHPSSAGHSVMACGLLTDLAATEAPSSLAINGRSFTSGRCKIENMKLNEDSISFTRTDDSLPVCLDSDVEYVSKYYPAISKMNEYKLKVTGLKEGNWKLVVDGMEVGTFTAAQLKEIDLSAYPGPWKKLAEQVNTLVAEQEQMYFHRWREVSLGQASVSDTELKKLDDEIDAKAAERLKLVSNRTWNWSLTRVQ